MENGKELSRFPNDHEKEHNRTPNDLQKDRRPILNGKQALGPKRLRKPCRACSPQRHAPYSKANPRA